MDSWKRKLRVGMVGGGQGSFIGAVHRIAVSMDQQAELVAGCFSRDLNNTKATGEQLYLDPLRCYSSYQEMADKEAELPPERRIDFVVVVTPNISHFPISKAFLEAGHHVVCDKPMTYSLDEAEQLVSLVEKSGLVYALTHNYTGFPMVREARELFRAGKMGSVRKIIAEYLQQFLTFPHEKHGSKQAIWRTDPTQSGVAGTLGDVGTHAFNLYEYITGDPVTELCADLSTFLPDRQLDEDGNILLRTQGGGKGVLVCSQVAVGEENGIRMRVYGSDGSIGWRQENPNYLDVWHYGQPRQTFSRGRDEFLSEAAMNASRIPWGHPEGYLEAFANIYCGAIEAIRRHADGNPMKTEEYTFPTVYDGLRGMKFVYKAVESSQQGSVWVRLD